MNINESFWNLQQLVRSLNPVLSESFDDYVFFISTSRPDDWFLYLINLTKEKNYTQTLQATLIIKWLNIHTIHLKIDSSFLSSESNGSYWNKNEQKKNTRTMHEHYELICIKFQEHKIICIQTKQKLLWIIREKFYT